MAKIYHYTKLSTAIEFILPSMTLRTNFLNKMNGPKENQKWTFGSINVPYGELYPELNLNIEPNIAHFDSMYKLGEEIKSKIQAISFVYSDTYEGYENESYIDEREYRLKIKAIEYYKLAYDNSQGSSFVVMLTMC